MHRHTETYGFKITQQVRNPAETILKIRMGGGGAWVQEQAEGLCAVPDLICSQGKKHSLGTCLLRGLSGYVHTALSGLSLETARAPLVICHLQPEHRAEPSWGCLHDQIASLFLSYSYGLGLGIHTCFLTILWC